MRKMSLFGLLAILAVFTSLAFSVDTLPVSIPLVNPSFEKGPEGWVSKDTRFQEMFSIDKTEKHSGEASLKVSDPEGTSNPFCGQRVTNLKGYATYRLRAWVKGEKGQSAQAAVKIEYYNDAGKNTSGDYGRVMTNPDSTWQTVEVVLKGDADTTRANILLRLFGKGTVYFDDVDFAMVKAAPLLFLSFPRIAVIPLTPKDIIVQIRPAKGITTGAQPIFTFDIQRLGSSDVTPAKVDLKAKDTDTWQATVQLPALVPGQYKLRCSLAKSHVAEKINLFVPPTRRKPEFLSDTGTIIVAGKPFFPIGLYHVSPAEYEMLAANGFNSAQGQAILGSKILSDGVSAAKKAGIMVDVPFYAAGQVMKNMPDSLEKIRLFGSHDNILNWKIVDEPDERPDIIDEVPIAYENLKKSDPKHPISLTIDNPNTYDYWANFCDILQVDPYPIPAHPLTMVSDFTAKAKAALQPWQNLTVVLQAGYKSNPTNQPTYEQARCMLYLALINGAKGIFWYSMHDPGWDLIKTPLWTRFKEINAETLELSNPIMLGTKVDGVKGIVPPLQWLCLKYEEKYFLLLANPGKDVIEANIEMPIQILKAAARGTIQVEVKGKSVKLSIPGPGAQLVVIEEK